MPLNLIEDSLSILPHISHMRRASLTQATPCLPVGPLTGTTPLTALAPKYYNSGKGGPPVPRPFMGGVQSGFHAMPALGDDFLTLYEPKFKPAGSLSVAFDPTKLDVLAPGESFQRHADGRIADYLKADGSTTIYSAPSPAVSILVSGAGALTLTAPTLSLTSVGGLTLSGNTHITGTLGVSGLATLSTGAAITGGLSLTGGLTLIGQTIAPVTIFGSVSGSLATINFTEALSLVINGTTYRIPLI